MGKGSSWRKGTNFKAYQESDYWKLRDERIAKQNKKDSKNLDKKETSKS